METGLKINPETLQEYRKRLADQFKEKPASLNRKLSSLRQFTKWAGNEGYLAKTPQSRSPRHLGKVIVLTIVILIILGLSRFITISIPTKNPLSKLPVLKVTEPQTIIAGSSSWIIRFQGKLSSTNGQPIQESAKVVFKLYKEEKHGPPLWTSKTWPLEPNPQGEFVAPVGDTTQGDYELPSNYFFQEKELFLGVEVNGREVPERMRVSTADAAANSYLLQNYPPNLEAGPLTIPVINEDGALVLAAQNPSIKAVSGTLGISADSLSLITPDASDGSITLNPDGKGVVNLLFEGKAPIGGDGFLNAKNANQTSGALIYGEVANNATGYRLIELVSGSTPTTRFSVDGSGNTFMAGQLTAQSGQLTNDLNLVSGNLKTGGVTRLTNAGRLSSISGYYQNSGEFRIDQGAPDLAKITKSGVTASADSLTITMDETNHSTSNYDTLVLNRQGGGPTAYALYLAAGNALFEGTLEVKKGLTANENLDVRGDTTLGDATTDKVTFNAQIASSIIPFTTSTYDLGSASKTWRNLYVDNIYGGGTVQGFWQRNSGALSPTNITDDVLLGATATSSALIKLTGTSGNNSWINTGNFGIGKTNPSYKLDISGSLGVGSTAYFASNVGIGTTAPGATLDIVGDLKIGTLASGTTNTVLTHSSGTVQSRSIDSRVWGTSLVDFSGTGNANYLAKFSDDETILKSVMYETGSQIGIGKTNPGYQLDLSSSLGVGGTAYFASNVGIGTTSPSYNLDVSGTAIRLNAPVGINRDPDVSYSLVVTGQEYHGGGLVYLAAGANMAGSTLSGHTAASGNLTLDSTSNATKGYIILQPTSGNVGIGTTAPVSKLEVSGTNIGKALTIFNETGTNDILVASASGTARFVVENDGTLKAARFEDEVGGNATGYFLDPAATGTSLVTAGSVGIGTTGPGALLDVDRPDTSSNSELITTRSSATTQTITGAVANARFNQFLTNTITAATAQTVTNAATLYIEGATTAAGVGPASITNNYALWVDAGDARFDGGVIANTLLVGRAAGQITYNGAGTIIIGDTTNDAVTIQTGGGNDITLTPSSGGDTLITSGNVGIGTTGPNNRLEVLSTTTPQLRVAYDTSAYFTTAVAGTTGAVTLDTNGTAPSFTFSDSVTANTFSSSGVTITGGTINNTTIGATTPSTGAFTTLTSSGNTTLGTGASGAHTYSTGAGSTTTLGNSTGTLTLASGGTSAWTNTSGNLTISTATSGTLALTSAGALNLSAGAASTWTLPAVANALNIDVNTLTIDALNNRVGIGTTGPGAQLDVYGGSLQVTNSIGTMFEMNLSSGTLNVGGGNQDGEIQVRDLNGNVKSFFAGKSGVASYINNGGSVGIGTTNPGATLEITGNLQFTTGATRTIQVQTAATDTAGNNLQIVGGQAGTYAGSGGSGGDVYIDGGASTGGGNVAGDVLLASSRGNVGIATTNPSYKLDVNGSLGIGGTAWFGSNVGIGTTAPSSLLELSSTAPTLRMTDTTASAKSLLITTDGNLAQFEEVGGSANDLLVLDLANARVGIGTTAPTTTLDVVGDASASGSLVLRGTSPVTLDILNGSRLDIQTSVGGDTGLTPKLTVLNNGNVGIGTTGPTEKLDVEGGFSLLNSQASTTNRNYGPVLWSDKAFGMELGYDGVWSTRIFTRNASEAITFGRMPTTATLQSDFVEWTRIVNGNVGIGTTNPGSTLEVNGEITQNTFTQVGADPMCWDGTAPSKIGDCTSLQKYKTNIQDLNLGLNDLIKLTPREFDWTPEMGGKHDLGFVAEEVEKISPLLVTYRDGILAGVKYERMSALFAKAIQEQQSQIVSLANQISSLKASLIQTQELITNNITTNNLVINNKLVSPVVYTEQLEAGSVETDEIGIRNQELGIRNKDSEMVMKIDNEGKTTHFGDLLVQGDTTIAGQLTSDALQVTRDATVAGTLYADEIVTKKGTFGELMAATVSAQNLAQANLSEIERRLAELESSNQPTPTLSVDSASSGSPTPTPNPEPVEGQPATSSALLSDAQNWQLTDPTGDLKITSDIRITGKTNLAQTIIAGPLSQDGSLIIDEGNSINVTTGTLYLQNLGFGGVDILAGKMVIDLNGNVQIAGNLAVGGEVSAAKLALDAKDSAFGKLLEIKGPTGEIVASVDASGSAQFAQLQTQKLIIATDTQQSAISNQQSGITTNATAGEAILPAGATEITINSQFVTDNTLVYVTPLGSTQNQVLYVKSKQSGGWFKVGIDTPIAQDIKFNWWIIN